MAKHGKGRRRQRYIPGVIDETVTVGALASLDVAKQDFDDVVTERTFVPSMEATWSLNGNTPAEGLLIVGIAHSDYTAAEIEEFLENTGAWSEGDLVNQEIAKRKIRIVGTFLGLLAEERLKDGILIKTRLGWILNTGQTLSGWVYNRDGSGRTTGGSVVLQGVAHLLPR